MSAWLYIFRLTGNCNPLKLNPQGLGGATVEETRKPQQVPSGQWQAHSSDPTGVQQEEQESRHLQVLTPATPIHSNTTGRVIVLSASAVGNRASSSLRAGRAAGRGGEVRPAANRVGKPPSTATEIAPVKMTVWVSSGHAASHPLYREYHIESTTLVHQLARTAARAPPSEHKDQGGEGPTPQQHQGAAAQHTLAHHRATSCWTVARACSAGRGELGSATCVQGQSMCEFLVAVHC